ncbi:hypothetical protein CBF23_005990 [Marinomonas agarivorans]|nr:hypothetical protein CBF23_005990 [Marinomonas agarivorans]
MENINKATVKASTQNNNVLDQINTQEFSLEQVKQLHSQISSKPKFGLGIGGGPSISYVR